LDWTDGRSASPILNSFGRSLNSRRFVGGLDVVPDVVARSRLLAFCRAF
jgi:hypothetical protein